jgi:general secretion pathway protein J
MMRKYKNGPLSLRHWPSGTRNCPSGFTLLEMLLAITIFSIIVVLIGGAMRLGYRSADAGERRIESTERLRRSVAIIESQIQSMLPLTYNSDAETISYFAGDKKTLTMATNYSIWEGKRGYVVAEYTVKQESSGKESLYVSESTLGTEAKSETALLKDCEVIEFAYLQKGLTEEETKWVDQWVTEDTGNAGPERIRVHFKYRSWDYSFVVPVRAGVKT